MVRVQLIHHVVVVGYDHSYGRTLIWDVVLGRIVRNRSRGGMARCVVVVTRRISIHRDNRRGHRQVGATRCRHRVILGGCRRRRRTGGSYIRIRIIVIVLVGRTMTILGSGSNHQCAGGWGGWDQLYDYLVVVVVMDRRTTRLSLLDGRNFHGMRIGQTMDPKLIGR